MALQSRSKLRLLGVLLVAVFIVLSARPAAAARLKDIADIEGVRGNQLIGYGVVIGLAGSGDKRGAIFTPQTLANMLERMGVRVDPLRLQVTNVASVMVTGELPAFARPGSKLDVTLSSIGDATSLQGGFLVMTPLKGADGNVYAVAQGGVSVGGFVVDGGGNTAQKNHPTVGRVMGGANVERAIPFDLFASGQIRIVLRSPDFVTVTRVQEAINRLVGPGRAIAIDGSSVVLPLDPQLGKSAIQVVAKLEQLEVEPDVPARVVVNERTGTVIMGEHVRVSTVGLAHGNLNISISQLNQISQPNGLAGGQTAGISNTQVNVGEEAGKLSLINRTVSIADVVKALNSLGATPRDLIAIFQALKQAGALQADLIIM